MAAAGPSQVMVTQLVKDVVQDGGFHFEDAGVQSLKGVPGSWQLWAVRASGAPEVTQSALGEA